MVVYYDIHSASEYKVHTEVPILSELVECCGCTGLLANIIIN